MCLKLSQLAFLWSNSLTDVFLRQYGSYIQFNLPVYSKYTPEIDAIKFLANYIAKIGQILHSGYLGEISVQWAYC